MVRSSLKSASRQKRGPDAVRHCNGAPRGAASFARGRAHREVRVMWRHAALHPPAFLPGSGKLVPAKAGREGGLPGALNNTGNESRLE